MSNDCFDNNNIHPSNQPRLTQETIRLRVYKKQTSRVERLSIITKQINEGVIEPSLKDCLVSLIKDPSQRSNSDNNHIKDFLLKSELANKFRMDNFAEENLNELLSLISTEMKHFFLAKDNILFHIGDDGDNFYLILQGRVSVLKPILVKEQMTGFQYFTHLMNLYTSNENYLLTLSLENNKKLINILKEDLIDLSLIVFKICLEEYFAKTEFSGKTLQELSKMCFVPSLYFDDIITSENEDITNPILLQKEKNELFERLSKFDQTTTKRYRLLANDKIKFNVNLFKYTTKLWLHKGNYFGDVALDQHTTRNATIRTEENTHFCYIDYTHYNNCLRYEKQKLNIKEISFLVDNYFFKSMQYKDFEKKIFVCFECQERYKNSFICYEDEPANYLYFIREGQIELTIHKSMSDMFEMIKLLRKKINKKETIKRQLALLPKDPYLKNIMINVKIKHKIFLFNKIELIGLESIFYGMNFLYSAQVVSDKAKIYKIENEHILKLLNDKALGKELMVNYKESAIKKMEILINRLHDLYDLKLEMYNKKYTVNIGKVLIEEDNDIKNNNLNRIRKINYSPSNKMINTKGNNNIIVFKGNNSVKNKELNFHCNISLDKTKNISMSPSTEMLPTLSPSHSCLSYFQNNYPIPRKKNFSQEYIFHTHEKDQDSLISYNKHKICSMTSFPNQKGYDPFKCEDLLLNRIKHELSRDRKYKKELLQNKLDFINGVDIDLDNPSNYKYIFREPVIYKIYQAKKKQQSIPKHSLVTKFDLGKDDSKLFPFQRMTLYHKYKYMRKPKLIINTKITSSKNNFSTSNIEKSVSIYNNNSSTIINTKNNIKPN